MFVFVMFIALTSPDGGSVLVNMDQVVSMTKNALDAPRSCEKRCTRMVFTSGTQQYVFEPVPEILKKMDDK